MIYELRSYTYKVGKLPLVLAQCERLLPIWERLSIRQVGFWTVAIGECNQVLHYMLAWQSLAEREDKWAQFYKDPQWLEELRRLDADGDVYDCTSNSILVPTAFSAAR